MGLLRSELMKHGTIVLPVQDARRYIDKIGKTTNIQFDDMNGGKDGAHFKRPYKKYVQRIDEMERIIRFMLEELNRFDNCKLTTQRVNEFLDGDETYKLDDVESDLQLLYKQFVEFKERDAFIQGQRNQSVEEQQVVTAAIQIMGGAVASSQGGLEKPLLSDDRKVDYLAGVVPKVDQARFVRALWRASRGNAFTQVNPIAESVFDPKTGQKVEKSVFVVYFQAASSGDSSSKGLSMKEKLMKVCQAFSVNMYAWPDSVGAASRRKLELERRLADNNLTLNSCHSFFIDMVADLVKPPSQRPTANSTLEEWRLFCIKEKAIYTILNQCREGMALSCGVWYPEADESKVHNLLKSLRGDDGQGAFLTPDRMAAASLPPTYIKTNEYTESFQEVINTYGIPAYQEANPALFTVVTFPFIFGMMYGDVGHGGLLLLTGIFLVMKGEQFRFSAPAVFGARYLVLSLGIFATFAGFMYNDFFSIGLPLFESGWEDKDGDGSFEPTYDVTNSGGPGPYPFGLDWRWVGASNELLYVNSMKMKLSVLFGVLQMVVGVLLRWSNAFKTRNLTDFVFECIPMMVFMLCFFGWMDVMILYKWTHPIDNPPNIINSLICMAMGQEDKNPLWDGSVEMAQTLMKYTVAAVPLMLLPKPFILLAQHNAAAKKQQQGHMPVDAETGHSGGHGHGEEFEFGEVFIHQIIETIEYVLGTVSHTASYLRIWALSLAHQQLSLVFFQKTLQMGLEMSFPANGIAIYFMFTAWFGITLGVLLGMDVLECFLHTLRLHWVEFQSKFYKAGGEAFAPFNVRKLIQDASE